MIGIIDYGMGNLGSVLNMFKKISASAKIIGNSEDILKAEKILLPGVGSFDIAMRRINDLGFLPALEQKAMIEKVPVLGICLGMQLLTEGSEEGILPGLAWIPGKTMKFNFPIDSRLKIPHMGWNEVKQINPSSLIVDLPTDTRFYFVHSYYVQTTFRTNTIMTSSYGIEFDSVIQKGNIFGAQFHPEKSHKYGMRLLMNFASL